MSYPYSIDGGAAADPHDLKYSVYDPRYVQNPEGQLGIPTHLESGGFWYRSDVSEAQYVTEPSDYGRGMPMSTSEHSIKHRRTRTGCFTCRGRRVKCDETRPTCDRCRKGNRHCEYPPPATPSSKKHKHGSKHSDSRSNSTSNSGSAHRDHDDKSTSPVIGLKTIKDESEDEPSADETSQTRPRLDRIRTSSSQSLTRRQPWRQHSEASGTSSASKDKVMTPSSNSSSSQSHVETPASFPTNRSLSAESRASRWADRREDIQKYLLYHDQEITMFHYFLKFDMEDFIHVELIDKALQYEPLLYAVLAFSAYHHTLRQPDGQITTFLSYYNKSINLLLKSLSKGAKPTEASILAVLQLTTFEEYLGDWVSLVGHHRAAHYMLLELYTSENIMETETKRQIFAWYARFDVIAGLMASNETVLDRRWYTACTTYFDERIDPEDIDVEYTLQYIIAQCRLIGMDMAALFSKLAKGGISPPEFQAENIRLTTDMQLLKSRIESMNDGYYTEQDFPAAVPLTSTDIVNPYVPGGLFKGVFWPLNYAWCDWYGIHEMHQYQTSLALGRAPGVNLELISLELCRIFEAIERYPSAPPGSCLAAHTSLALASVFLKKDERHIMWARHKLASVERQGYVFPPTFRQKMALLWGVPEVEHWWLPNEEGYLPILKEVRTLILERVNQAKEDGARAGDDLRDIKALFSRMTVTSGGGSTADSDGSPGSQGSGIQGHSSSPTLPMAGVPRPGEIGGGEAANARQRGSSISGSAAMPPPQSTEELRHLRRRSQGQINRQRRQQQADDRMSWSGGA